MGKEVFCVNCRYSKLTIKGNHFIVTSCRHKNNIVICKTAYEQRIVYDDCYKFNNKNNCPNYKRKWWKFGV